MTHLTSNLKYWSDSSSSSLPWLQSLWGVQQNIYWGWKDLQSHCTLSTSVSFWVFESLEAASPVRYDWTVVCVYRCSNVVHTVMLVFNAAPPEASQVFSVCFQRCPPPHVQRFLQVWIVSHWLDSRHHRRINITKSFLNQLRRCFRMKISTAAAV